MEYETSIEASSINNIYTLENVFSSCYSWSFMSSFFSDIVKKVEYTLVYMTLFHLSGEESIK